MNIKQATLYDLSSDELYDKSYCGLFYKEIRNANYMFTMYI